MAGAVTRSQQELLRAYGIKPVKRRGQNFLIDGNLARSWTSAKTFWNSEPVAAL